MGFFHIPKTSENFQIPFWIPSAKHLKAIQIPKNLVKIQNFCIVKNHSISFIYKDLQRFYFQKKMKVFNAKMTLVSEFKTYNIK